MCYASTMHTETGITEGAYVTLEQTRGWATDSPITTRREGVATRDEDGTLRVDGVNVERDEAGYYPQGVLILSITL